MYLEINIDYLDSKLKPKITLDGVDPLESHVVRFNYLPSLHSCL
jgi:hypothetical protein